MVHIYVLKCEDGKYYVGRTDDGLKRFNQHLGGRGAKWTKKYKPVDLAEWYPDKKNVHEKMITHKVMKKYGVRNVRGGPYTQVEMDESRISSIEESIGINQSKTKPIKTQSKIQTKPKSEKRTKTKCSRCGRTSHNITTCNANHHTNGKRLSDKTKAREKPIERTKPKCSRCGRDSHSVKGCYARTNISGKPITKSRKRKRGKPNPADVKRFIKAMKESKSRKKSR